MRDSFSSLIKTVVPRVIDQPCEDIVDEHALDALQEIAREDQQPWLTDGAFSMFATILSQSEYSI